MLAEPEAKLRNIIRSVLDLPRDEDVSRASQLSVERWDSLAHVSLMLAVEGEFDISIDIEDQMQLTSYNAIRLFLDEHAG